MGGSSASQRDPDRPGDPHQRRGQAARLVVARITGFSATGGLLWVISASSAYKSRISPRMYNVILGAEVTLAVGVGLVCIACALLVIVATIGVRARWFARITYLIRLLPRAAFFLTLVREGRSPDEVLPLGDVPPLDPPTGSAGAGLDAPAKNSAGGADGTGDSGSQSHSDNG